MIETLDANRRTRVEDFIKKRNLPKYEKCIAKKCASLAMTEVGSGTIMYYCPVHDYTGTVVV